MCNGGELFSSANYIQRNPDFGTPQSRSSQTENVVFGRVSRRHSILFANLGLLPPIPRSCLAALSNQIGLCERDINSNNPDLEATSRGGEFPIAVITLTSAEQDLLIFVTNLT